jgi:hypothetical protein
MNRIAKTTASAIGALLFLLLANRVHAEDFPKGTFTNKGPDDAVWSITFDGKNKVSVKREDKELVTLEYKVTKDEIEFSKEEGSIAEKDAKPGTYKWKLNGKKLTFTKVKDDSEGRAQALTSGSWEKKD